MKKIITSIVAIVSVLPIIAFAQLAQTDSLVFYAGLIIQRIISLAILIAFLFFVWGIAQFIRTAGDATARAEGKQRMIWGVIALAVLASIWGLVWWLQYEFNIVPAGTPLLQNTYRVF